MHLLIKVTIMTSQELGKYSDRSISNKVKILVTAANGHTGYPAAKELLRLGFSVRDRKSVV